MNIELRLEQPEDYRKTEEIMREAFWNYYAPGCYEHYLLHIMRNSPNFVKELDFVAVWENKIIGSVVCLKSFIAADNGNKYEILSMGPIAVLPKYQRMGVGKALIAHTRSVAAEMGCHSVVRGSRLLFKSRICGSRAIQYPHLRKQIYCSSPCVPFMAGCLSQCDGTILRG